MRKFLLAALALCLVGGAAAPTAAGPGAYGGAAQVAWADWIDMNGRTGTIHAALGIRGADTIFGLETVGVVFKGRCKRYRDGNGVIIMCVADGVAKMVGPHEFWVDPALDSASLDVAIGGFDHSVDWRGRRGGEYGGVRSNDRRTTASHVLFRDAKVRGNVYGRRFPWRGDFWNMGFLYEGAGARVERSLERRGIHLRDDGTIRIERMLRSGE